MRYGFAQGMAATVLVIAVTACGGGAKPAENPDPGPTAPPRLPPSMGGLGGPKIDTPDPTPAPGAAALSEDVAKGTKALEAGDFAGAKSAAEAALKKNAKDGDALALLGMAQEGLGDKAAAEKAYKDALKAKPDHEAAAVNLSAIQVDAQRWDDAEKTCRAAVEKHKDNALLHLNLAVALSGKKDQTGSAKEFDDAVRLAPKQPMALITYADRLAEWGQTDQAVTKLKAARGLAEGDVAMLATIGHSFLLLRAVAECVPTFDKAIALKDAAELRTERGLCKLASKDKAGATADFQAAVTKEPSYALGHYWLGAMKLQGGAPKDAKQELETYLKLAPTGPKAAAAKDLLTKLGKK
jgi:Tfp pilus assembly protein PilF